MAPEHLRARDSMDRDLLRDWQRWLAADESGRDDEADAAFRRVFQAVPRQVPRPGFPDRAMRAVEAVASKQARRSWWARVAAAMGMAVGGLVAAYVGVVALTPALVRLFVRFIEFSADAFVWVTLVLQGGLDLWAILAQVGSAVSAVIVAPRVSAVLVGVELAGAVALYALHRLLSSEEESS